MVPLRAATSLAIFLILGSLPACTGVETKLRPESEIPELAELGAKCEEARGPTIVEHSDATDGPPLAVAIHEYGPVGQDRVIVAIHGVLSDHRTWRYVIGGLGEKHEVWAIDMPGCGASDCPESEERPGEDAYSPDWLAKHVLCALENRLEGTERPRRITLVAHSLGGGVVMRMLGNPAYRTQYAHVLDRVDGAVLLAPLDFGFGRTSAKMIQLAVIDDMTITAGNVLGQVRKVSALAVYGGSKTPEIIPREDFERVFEILTDPQRRHAMQNMLRRAVPRDENDEIDWGRVDPMLEDYKKVGVPCLFLWGEWDETLPSTSGDRFVNDVPNSRLVIFKRRMHSIQTEEAVLCFEAIEKFIAQGIDSFPRKQSLERIPPTGPSLTGERAETKAAKKEISTRLNEKPATTAPSTVSVLSGRDVQRSGARYLSDSLRMLPGVEVQRLSSTESGVAIRGFLDTSTAAQGVLGLVDGRQVYNQFLGNVLWDQLAVRLEDVKDIEVVRGPGSFIHGPNAMHGVVNIRTKSPLDYEEDSVSAIAQAGSYDSVVVGSTVVNRTDKTGFKMSAQWDDIGQFGSEREDTRDKVFVEAAFEVRLDGSPDHILGLAAGLSDQKFDLLLPQVEVIPSTVTESEARESFARADYRWGAPEDFAFRARFSWTGFDADAVPVGYYERFGLDLDTWDVDTQFTGTPGAHFLTGGAGYRHSTVDTSNADVTNGRHSVNQFWLFAQDEWGLAEGLALTFGARLDLHSETGSAFSPRAAAVWEFAGGQFCRASAGRGFRYPSLRELWFDMEVQDVPGVPVTVTISGNEDLKAESLTSFELGYFGSWGPLVDVQPGSVIALEEDSETHQFEAGVTVFYNIIDDLISYQTNPDDPVDVLPMNQDDEEAYGFELEGRYVFSDTFSAMANWSYAVRRERDSGERSEFQPPQTANAGVAYSGFGLNTMLWLNYYGASKFGGLDIDGYFLLNGSVSYVFDVATRSTGQVFIRFFNVIGDVHREHPNGDEYGRIVTGGLQFDW